MKCVVLVLAALCGLSMGLQYPLSYEYEYMGQIKTGMRELRSQFAGAALKATVQVTVTSTSEAHVQISDSKVGDINSDVSQSGHSQLPISNWRPLHDKVALERSFTVQLSGQQEILEVPQTEMLWISNLRKSIASLLRVPFVLSSPPNSFSNTEANRISRDDKPMTSFKKMEKTVLGECRVLYTMTKAAPRKSMQLQQLEEDAQQSRRQERRSPLEAAPEADESSAYRLVRSVDLDDCSELVVMTKASHGNLTRAGTGQLRGVQSRSSVGEYLLSGKPSGQFSMRIEKAIVEGIVTINPFGHETKKMMTVTNQTLSLVKVTQSPLVAKPSSQLKRETWMFRVESPFKRAQDSPKWMSYLEKNDALQPMYPEKDMTGFRQNASFRQQLKEEVKSIIEQVARDIQQPNQLYEQAYGGSRDGMFVEKMLAVSMKIRALPHPDLESLFQQLASASQSVEQSNKRELVIGAFKVSGSSAAIRVLADKMKSKAISEAEAANIFLTLTSNVMSPAAVKDLMDFALSLADDAPIFLKSSALVNLASLVRRLCLDPAMEGYATQAPMMGDSQCRKEQLVKKFVSYLEYKLKSPTHDYLTAIVIKSLSNLGDQRSVQALVGVAQSPQTAQPVCVRLMAIQGLTRNHMQNPSYSLAQMVLVAIAEGQVEEPILRESAIASLILLSQNATFWHRLALSTWREPSRRVASFIYSAIKSMADSKNRQYIRQISMAKHVLPLAKPQLTFPHYSGMYFWRQFLLEKDLAAGSDLLYLISESSSMPQHAAARALGVFGGIKVPFVDASVTGEGLASFSRMVWKMMAPVMAEQDRHSPAEAEHHWRRFTESHQTPMAPSEAPLYLDIKLLGNMQLFVPYTRDAMQQLQDKSKSVLARVMDSLRQNKRFSCLSFSNLMDVSESIPSDMGLPIIMQVSRPVMAYSDVAAQLVSTGRDGSPASSLLMAARMNITGDLVTKVIVQSQSSMRVLVPWSNHSLVVGVDGESSFSFSGGVSLDGYRTNTRGDKMLQFRMEPRHSQQTVVGLTRSLPYTAVRGLFASSSPLSQDRSLKPITVVNDKPYYDRKVLLKKEYAGLDMELDFKGDEQFPINSTTIWKVILEPARAAGILATPTTCQYQLALLYSPQRSQSSRIAGALTLRHPSSQSSDDRQTVESLSAQDTQQQREQKLDRMRAVHWIASASINFTGSEAPRQYEAALIKFNKNNNNNNEMRQEREYQVNLMRGPLPSASGDKQVCIRSTVQYPRLPAGASLSQVLAAPLQITSLMKVFYGSRCSQDSEYLEVKSIGDVSSERVEYLKRILPNTDQFQALDPTEAVKSTAVYDRLSAQFTRKKVFSPRMKELLNQVDDIVEALVFPKLEKTVVTQIQNRPGVMVTASRSLVTDRLTVWVQRGVNVCMAPDLKVPAALDYLLPLTGNMQRQDPEQLQQHSQVLEAITSNKCVLAPASVKTFAGVRYSKLPSKCQTIVAKSFKQGDEKFVILAKQTEESQSAGQEVMIVYPKTGLIVLIKKDGVFVNGQKHPEDVSVLRKSPISAQLATVYQSDSSRKIKLAGKTFSVELKDGKDVIVHMDDRFRSNLVGMCGKFGRDQAGDLQDSVGCLYTANSGKYFAASWIASSEEVEQCRQNSSAEVKKVMDEVKEIQQRCPKTLHAQAGRRQQRREEL